MRLDQYVAHACGESRAQVRKQILKGAVTVDGGVCRKADTHIDPAAAQVALHGALLSHTRFVYLMVDKPQGVVSASRDAREQTVADLVAGQYPRRNLFPAGRLDKASTGFVLLTDDGAFAHDLLAPKRRVPKTYEVLLDTPLTQAMCEAFATGVTLVDGTVLKPAQLEAGSNGPCSARVVLTQGVYHQIKRMFGTLDAGVNELRRVAIGSVALDETLGAGGFRPLLPAELEALRAATKQGLGDSASPVTK